MYMYNPNWSILLITLATALNGLNVSRAHDLCLFFWLGPSSMLQPLLVFLLGFIQFSWLVVAVSRVIYELGL